MIGAMIDDGRCCVDVGADGPGALRCLIWLQIDKFKLEVVDQGLSVELEPTIGIDQVYPVLQCTG
jgi:hypothetical protein